MGTRNLTIVVHDGKNKIAQYGQWDGYPPGQGKTALAFARAHLADAAKRKKFVKQLALVRFVTPAETQAKIDEIKGGTGSDGWMTSEQAEKFGAAFPYLSRDYGAQILDLVRKAKSEVVLRDETSFAADSLFCEWAYVIDLDLRRFEVYKGFNKEKLEDGQRFKDAVQDGDNKNEYAPIKMIKSYALSKLPTPSQFLKDMKPLDEDDDG